MQKSKLYSYSDYKSYLRTHAVDSRKRSKKWSYGAWARQMKLSGTAALTMVVNGHRHPGPQLSDSLTRYFGFSANEREYFLDLIELQKAKGNSRLQVVLMERLAKHHPRGTFALLSTEAFASIAHWHYCAIREIVQLKDFREDSDWIAKKLQFKVTAREIEKAIQDLLRLGLLVRDPMSERLSSSDTSIDTSHDIADEAIKRFHEQIADLSKQALRFVPVLEREFSGTTLNVLEEHLPKAKEMLRKFQDEFCANFEKRPGNRIYQLNLQFFPLTKKEASI